MTQQQHTTARPMGEPLRQVKIKFYKTKDQYGMFSNFALEYPIELDGKLWPTSEHYYQAPKMVQKKDQEAIRKADSPALAAKLGRDKAKQKCQDWKDIKLGVMRKCLEAKFTQHPKLGSLLMGTKGAKLIEHTVNDSFWGDGGNGSGENWLGRLLMELREKLSIERARKI